MTRLNEFPRSTQQLALARQAFRCGSCGTRILQIGNEGRAAHAFGEGANAHHMRPIKSGGTSSVDNCVILCTSCHYTVHEGGNYRFGKVMSNERDYPYFRAAKGR